MKKKLIALRNNDVTTLIYGNRHYSFRGEKAEQIYNQCMDCKIDPSEDNFAILEEIITPIKKVVHLGLIEEDSKGKFFLKGTNYPMPQALAKQILEFSEKGHPFEPLIKFWKLCLLNPNKEARDGFFKYCMKFGIIITDNGHAVIYKAVNRGENKTPGLAEFVAKEYAKVKRWKKSPNNYDVWSDINGNFIKEDRNKPTLDNTNTVEYFGTLDKLYENIGNMISDEDAFRPIFQGGDYGKIIRLGEPVKMPREECDSDIKRDCSRGLHVGHTSYVSTFGYSNSVLLACLVNPMNIVALPEYDHSKIRVCEYYPYAVLEKEEDGSLSEITDEVYWEEDYKDYEDEIFEKLRDGDFSDDPMMEENDTDVVYVSKML